jgi:hypothetical protein
MYVVVHHRIKDAQTAFSRGENLLEGKGAPPGVRGLQFYPSQDQSAVTCLWEADSVDEVREYVDSTLGDSSENSYFEVDAKQARGLPQPATTGA